MPIVSSEFNAAMSGASTACQAVHGQLASVLDEVNRLVDIPRALINAATRTLNNTVDLIRQLADIENALEAAGIGNFATMNLPDTTGIRSALRTILTCPGLPSNVVQSAQDIMDLIDDGASTIEDLPRELMEDVFGAVQDSINAQVDEVLASTPLGKIAGLNAEYSGLLSSLGITDALESADSLLNCLSMTCDTMASFPGILDTYADSISGMYTSIGAAPGEAASFVKAVGVNTAENVGTAFSGIVNSITNTRGFISYF